MDKAPPDEKHQKYFNSYKPNELFWGIGIENETYLEILRKESVKGSFFKNQKQERYSVNYYKSYRQGWFNKALDTIINKDENYDLPILMNSHELIKNDLSGEPMANYNKGATPNKKFSGKTVFEYMKEKNKYFNDEYGLSYCFDGDTIEFMTLDFYKSTTQKVISELLYHKKQFLDNLNKLKLPLTKGANFRYPPENYGFIRFTTNMNNLSIFNNGTYHFNFTLPTKLNSAGNIEDYKSFERTHAMAIRVIQVLEPFFVAKFGSGDPLSKSDIYKRRFPRGSQRAAASRYISIGTFDTNRLQTGKLLQDSRELYETQWYKDLYLQIHYEKNDKIGFDINFNKFKNHGIEIRFFDYFPEKYLDEVMTFLVYLLDHSIELKYLESCIQNETYNSIVYKAIFEGKDAILTKEELLWVSKILMLKFKFESRKILDIYEDIYRYLKNKYKYNGPCSSVMLEKPINVCCI
jgi:hypothetical protein